MSPHQIETEWPRTFATLRREQEQAEKQELAELRRLRRALLTAHIWRDEQGRRFVYADDIEAMLDQPSGVVS